MAGRDVPIHQANGDRRKNVMATKVVRNAAGNFISDDLYQVVAGDA